MRAGGGMAKGSSFERDVCRRLSLWMSRGLRSDLFWRSAMSGGRATVAHKAGRKVAQGGDITAVDPWGDRLTSRFCIECKHYKKIDVHTLLKAGNHGNISEWWLQCQRDAERQDKLPMLIARGYGQEFVMLTVSGTFLLRVGTVAVFPEHGANVVNFSTFLLTARRPQ